MYYWLSFEFGEPVWLGLGYYLKLATLTLQLIKSYLLILTISQTQLATTLFTFIPMPSLHSRLSPFLHGGSCHGGLARILESRLLRITGTSE